MTFRSPTLFQGYHNEDGFVHCATNVIRVVPGPKMWWEI